MATVHRRHCSALLRGPTTRKGDRMSPRSVARTVLARLWTPLVAVVALALGTVARWKVHRMSARGHVTTVTGPGAPPEFNLKRLTFELSGSVGEGGCSCTWSNGHPHRVALTTSSW